MLGVKVAASTVREILKDAGIDTALQRTRTTWATFLRSQAHAIIAADFFQTTTLTGVRLNVLAVIEHATRPVRVLAVAAHRLRRGWPRTWSWTSTTPGSKTNT